jgi:hypothetical protein
LQGFIKHIRKSSKLKFNFLFKFEFKKCFKLNLKKGDLTSEATSISGGELSGDTFASPNTSTHQYSNDERNERLNAIESALIKMDLNRNKSPETSGLLSIDTRSVDERSHSFIDSKCFDREILEEAEKDKVKATSVTATTTTTTPPTSLTNQSSIIEVSYKENAFLIIKRLMGCLGNVNQIKDSQIHEKIFEFIYSKWELLAKVRESLKLTDLSDLIPPISTFSPWLFEAIYELPNNYKNGQLIAYKLLCRVALRSATAKLLLGSEENSFDRIDDEFMDLFMLTLHHGLRSGDMVIKIFYLYLI